MSVPNPESTIAHLINNAIKPDPLARALARLSIDVGALFEGEVLEQLRSVRQNDHARYARIRAEAKNAKVSVTELDRLTVPAKADGQQDVFTDIEPASDEVHGADLLESIRHVLHQHVIADPPTITAAALWVVHTWFMDSLSVSPLAHITAPEKRCGKTILLTALGRLAYRPLPVSNISSAALFRSMELWRPTLLIDEVDAFLKDNEEARGLINAGLYRETAFVVRTVGDDHIPTKFSIWGAKALCGIGKLADTIEDRSVPLRMRRKKEGERVDSIRHSNPGIWSSLQAQIARWVEDNRHLVSKARPATAGGLNDRAQDCWEPLFAIADAAGGEWPSRARSAALSLHGVQEDSPSIGVELLGDIQAAFKSRGTSRLATAELLRVLTEDDEQRWATWNRGREMTPRQLSTRLSEFGVRSKNLKMGMGQVNKGYDLSDFHDAFERYLFSPDNPQKSATPLQPHRNAGYEEFAGATVADAKNATDTPQTAPQSQSSAVAAKNDDFGKKESQKEKTAASADKREGIDI